MIRFVLISCAFFATASSVQSNEEDRFWILWEKYRYVGENCPDGSACIKRRNFSSRLFEPKSKEAVYRLFGMLDASALSSGRRVEHPEAPTICQHNDAEVLLGFDPEKRALSDKLDTLRDLKGIHFDVSKLKAPAGFNDSFGDDLQTYFLESFEKAGIKIYSKEEIEKIPGKPKLSVFFSHANVDTGCTYSVFASLSQTVLLTRNLTTKISAGTWAFSTGPTAEFPDATEFDAIKRVADAFASDFKKANK